MPDVIVVLVMFALIFAFITTGNWALAVVFGIVSVVMFMPTQDGIFYACILENIRFLFSKKTYTVKAKSAKENVDALIPLKGIKDNGLIEYTGGSFGRVIKVGQKNFGIEDEVQQNIDIGYFANALKLIDGNQSADIVKIDRPVNLDAFAGELFGRLAEIQRNIDEKEENSIKESILCERIDAIDRLNNIRKQYISDYYIVLYGRNELDLENAAVNVSSEINKCGLNTKLLDKRETAVFLKYSYSRNFDEREVKDLSDEERGINSSSLAAVFPFVRIFVMDKGGIMLGENKANRYPFIFDLWKRGNLYQNSNAMIIGKSGSGKSFFLKNLILNEWANNTRVIVCDPENEYVTLTRNLKGNVIDVGNAKEGRINPFHIYKILTEEGTPADPVVTFNTHLKMLESFFKIVLVGASQDVIELINNLVVETYERKGITETTDCSDFRAEDFPLFSDLLETLQAKDKESMDSLTLRDMRTAELYLQKFVTGRYSDIWNAPSTLRVDASIIDFNFQSLFANKNNVVANSQMLLVFRFIEQEVINAREMNRYGKNLHTLIIVDEGHLFIDAKFPIALDFFYQMSKFIYSRYNEKFLFSFNSYTDYSSCCSDYN